MVITWLDFGEILLKTVILTNFLWNFRMCFFKVKHYFGHISWMVGPIDVKWKGSALVGYWVQYMTLTFDLTHDLDLGCFKVKFRNSSISGIVGLIYVKWKGSELIWYWADCMTLTLGFLGQSLKKLYLSNGAADWQWTKRMWVIDLFMTMILTCVTMVRWADVPDSDQGDFRHRRAVDISSLQILITLLDIWLSVSELRQIYMLMAYRRPRAAVHCLPYHVSWVS